MKQTTPFLAFLLACGQPSATPSGPDGLEPPVPTEPAAADPFGRIGPEDIPPTIDTAWFDCDGLDWTVNTDVAGRPATARAVVVRTTGDPLALELEMVPAEIVEGALQQPFRGVVPGASIPCNRAGVSTVVETHDAAGALLDCIAFGPDAEALLAGSLDDRLGAIPRGDWGSCRLR